MLAICCGYCYYKWCIDSSIAAVQRACEVNHGDGYLNRKWPFKCPLRFNHRLLQPEISQKIHANYRYNVVI